MNRNVFSAFAISCLMGSAFAPGSVSGASIESWVAPATLPVVHHSDEVEIGTSRARSASDASWVMRAHSPAHGADEFEIGTVVSSSSPIARQLEMLQKRMDEMNAKLSMLIPHPPACEEAPVGFELGNAGSTPSVVDLPLAIEDCDAKTEKIEELTAQLTAMQSELAAMQGQNADQRMLLEQLNITRTALSTQLDLAQQEKERLKVELSERQLEEQRQIEAAIAQSQLDQVHTIAAPETHPSHAADSTIVELVGLLWRAAIGHTESLEALCRHSKYKDLEDLSTAKNLYYADQLLGKLSDLLTPLTPEERQDIAKKALSQAPAFDPAGEYEGNLNSELGSAANNCVCAMLEAAQDGRKIVIPD